MRKIVAGSIMLSIPIGLAAYYQPEVAAAVLVFGLWCGGVILICTGVMEKL